MFILFFKVLVNDGFLGVAKFIGHENNFINKITSYPL